MRVILLLKPNMISKSLNTLMKRTLHIGPLNKLHSHVMRLVEGAIMINLDPKETASLIVVSCGEPNCENPWGRTMTGELIGLEKFSIFLSILQESIYNMRARRWKLLSVAHFGRGFANVKFIFASEQNKKCILCTSERVTLKYVSGFSWFKPYDRTHPCEPIRCG